MNRTEIKHFRFWMLFFLCSVSISVQGQIDSLLALYDYRNTGLPVITIETDNREESPADPA